MSVGAVPAVLAIEDLRTHFHTRDGVVRAVDGVTLSLARGETLGIVGESGCGKSVTALSVMRLVPPATGRIVAGSIRFDGTELLTLDPAEMRAIRGNRIGMIFQEPMTASTGDDCGAADCRKRRPASGFAGAASTGRWRCDAVKIPEPRGERRIRISPAACGSA
jgi:ABC-type oligopeptide transport system ATPase subunit